jgi:tetratricopeptide (TPR) repeat protein
MLHGIVARMRLQPDGLRAQDHVARGRWVSARYAKSSKPPKRPPIKLSKFQLVAAIGAVLLVCGLIGGIVGTIILDEMASDDGDSNEAVINSSQLREELRQDAEDNPDDAMAQAAYANYLANTGDVQTAIPFYERAIALDPQNWSVRLDFSQSLSSSGLLADAELQLDRILELDRENAQGWYYLAELYQSFDPPRTDEAIFAYQQVIRFDPESFIASQAAASLNQLGVATPAASPITSPEASS